jgi:hypothetical protein
MKLKLIAIAATMALGAVAAVGAGAFDRDPVAPQLSPEESGVKPGVVPGEVQEIRTPAGTASGEVSPCIESDPAGYSEAELSDPEWCFHRPGKAPAADPRDPDAAGVIYRLRDGRIERVGRVPPSD